MEFLLNETPERSRTAVKAQVRYEIAALYYESSLTLDAAFKKADEFLARVALEEAARQG